MKFEHYLLPNNINNNNNAIHILAFHDDDNNKNDTTSTTTQSNDSPNNKNGERIWYHDPSISECIVSTSTATTKTIISYILFTNDARGTRNTYGGGSITRMYWSTFIEYTIRFGSVL